MRDAIRAAWEANTGYAISLVRDVRPDQFIAQPVAGITMNHPAWVLSHLNVYAPIVAAMLRGEAFDDPADHRYGRNSKVINDPSEYLAKDELVEAYSRAHDDALRAIKEADDRVLTMPTPLARWRSSKPTIGAMLLELMVRHESIHLGQLSAWRRAMGLPPV